MFESITTGFIIILIGIAAGLGVDIALKRVFGLEQPTEEDASPALPGIADKLSNVVSRLAPISRTVMDSTRDSLDRAGSTMQPATFWAFRVASAAGFTATGLVASLFIGGAKGLGIFAALALTGIAIPQLWLLNERAKWRDELDRQLPDALDLLAICMSAGSSIDFALHTVGSKMDGAIAQGFERVANEASFSSRTEALLRFAERARVPSLTIFAASFAQSERAGGSLVDIIRDQAETVREQRRLKVESEIEKLGTKMLFPIILFILPVFLIVVLAPVLAQIAQTFTSLM